MLTNSDYLQIIDEIEKSDSYKGLMKEYYNSLDTMEASMNEEQFKMVLAHERILREIKIYIQNENITRRMNSFMLPE